MCATSWVSDDLAHIKGFCTVMTDDTSLGPIMEMSQEWKFSQNFLSGMRDPSPDKVLKSVYNVVILLVTRN